MSKMVLARKWRPRNLQTLVGHDSVVRALTHAFTEQRLHQAYLFTGTRGIGKTTLARIMATCLNCETGITATPCGTCSVCRNIETNSFPDLIEIDAASRTKVEDTRDLLDGIPYAPQQGRYKIYLIDEVHMLSTHSFNALLKTLEEPPEHIIFILATTDPQKLPATILSRCLHFHLKPLTDSQISQQLETILQEEHIAFEPQAVARIAHAADGSLRDALSLTEQAIGMGAGTIDHNAAQALLNDVHLETIDNFLQALQEDNRTQLLAWIEDIHEQGIDFSTVMSALLESLQKIALLQVITNPSTVESTSEVYQSLAKLWDPEQVQLYYQILLLGRRDLTLAPNAKSGFTMILLRLLAFTPNTPNTTSNFEKISQQKPKINPAPSAATPSITAKTSAPSEKKIENAPVTITASPPKTTSHISAKNTLTNTIGHSQAWLSLIQVLPLDGLLQTILQQCAVTHYEHPTLILAIDPRQAALLDARNLARCEEVFEHYFQEKIHIHIEKGESNLITPALEARQHVANQQQQATNAIHRDPTVQSLQKRFSATIIPESIQPNSTLDEKQS